MRNRCGWMWRPGWADWALLLLVIMVAISVVISPFPHRSLVTIFPLAFGLVFYILLCYCTVKIWKFDAVLWVLIIAEVGLCLVILFGMVPLTGVPGFWFLRGMFSDTYNPNVVAGHLVVLLPFSVVKGLDGFQGRTWQSFGMWTVFILVTLCALAALVLCQSRGASLAALVGLILLGCWRWPRAARWGLPLLILISALASSIMGWRTFADTLLTASATKGLDQRLEIWSRTLYIIADFPFTGIGLGCFDSIVSLMYPLFLVPGGTVSHAHNLFLQISVDLGLPGLASYLSLLGISFGSVVAARRAFRKKEQRSLELLCVACLASLTAMCVHGLVDCAIWDNRGAFIPWIVMGLAAMLYRFCQQDTKSTPIK